MGIKKRITATLLTAIIAVMSLFVFSGCSEKASDYTEKEHIARVTKLAEKRYIQNGNYESLEVFPLYDENDKLGFFLIELQPVGHVYVKLNEKEMYGRSLYTRHEMFNHEWFYYVFDENAKTIVIDKNGNKLLYSGRRAIEVKASGEPILYECSPFALAEINNTKRYFITLQHSKYIAAIKRRDVFYNLISNEEVDFLGDSTVQSDIDASFHPSSYYNL